MTRYRVATRRLRNAALDCVMNKKNHCLLKSTPALLHDCLLSKALKSKQKKNKTSRDTFSTSSPRVSHF